MVCTRVWLCTRVLFLFRCLQCFEIVSTSQPTDASADTAETEHAASAALASKGALLCTMRVPRMPLSRSLSLSLSFFRSFCCAFLSIIATTGQCVGEACCPPPHTHTHTHTEDPTAVTNLVASCPANNLLSRCGVGGRQVFLRLRRFGCLLNTTPRHGKRPRAAERADGTHYAHLHGVSTHVPLAVACVCLCAPALCSAVWRGRDVPVHAHRQSQSCARMPCASSFTHLPVCPCRLFARCRKSPI